MTISINKIESPLIKKAREFATKAHEEVNQTYDGKPYDYHLLKAVKVHHLFDHLIHSSMREEVEAGIWCHDTIEDTGKTFNDVKKVTGEYAANIAYALTNEKGKNRKQRANGKYYRGIRYTENAAYSKMCDRIANILHSLETESRMLEVYKKEHADFVGELYTPELKPMFTYTNQLLGLDTNYKLTIPLWKRVYRSVEKLVYTKFFIF